MIRDSLADNVVEELPASLCNLIQLKSLCLDNNQVNQVNRLKCDLFLHALKLFFWFIESLYLLPLNSVTHIVFQIPDGLLIHCKSLQNLSLHNNPISMDQFQLVSQ